MTGTPGLFERCLVLFFGGVLAAGIGWCGVADANSPDDQRPRVIVTTDGEADDQCSMVRYLLYADQFRTRGLIYSSSKHHWSGTDEIPAKKWHGTDWIEGQIDAYAAVYSLLKTHADFPSPDALRGQIAVGNIATEGDMGVETRGSQHIVAELLADDPTPIWLLAWGGPNTIARALKTIAEEHPDQVAAVSAKAHIYLVSEQDTTYRDYIAQAWPSVTTLICSASTYGALAYRWEQALPNELHTYFTAEWTRENLLEDHGPLTALYPVRKDGAFRSEGDSPSFLHLIDTGLGSMADPAAGGWGGRFERRGGAWRSVTDSGAFESPLIPWIAGIQNDFAARADWCVLPRADANHAPEPTIIRPVAGGIAPGSRVPLTARAEAERGGETFRYCWWQYDDADSAPTVTIENADQADGAYFIAPDTQGPPCTSFWRLRTTVRPR